MQKKILSLVLGISMLLSSLLPASADTYTTKLQGTNTATMKDGSIISVDSDDFSMEEIEYHIIDSTDGAQSANVYAKIASTYSVTIPKVIVLKGVKGSASTATYKIDVDGDIAGNEYILVEPDYTALLHQGGKSDVNMDITQNLIKYRANNYTESLQSREVKIANTEDVIADGEGEGTVSATLTAGRWTGVFNFNIQLLEEENVETEDFKINILMDWGKNITTEIHYINENNKEEKITFDYAPSDYRLNFEKELKVKKDSTVILYMKDSSGNYEQINYASVFEPKYCKGIKIPSNINNFSISIDNGNIANLSTTNVEYITK